MQTGVSASASWRWTFGHSPPSERESPHAVVSSLPVLGVVEAYTCLDLELLPKLVEIVGDRGPVETGELQTALTAAVQAQQADIERQGLDRCLAAGIVSLLVPEADHVTIVHVGNCAVFKRTRDSLTRLTPLGTVLGEAIESGRITMAEAREHPSPMILSQFIGGRSGEPTLWHVARVQLRPSEQLVVTTSHVAWALTTSPTLQALDLPPNSNDCVQRLIKLGDPARIEGSALILERPTNQPENLLRATG
ncbi:MAG: hypothetical protein AAF962_21050 [Actinomycetota bacterium]